MRNKFDMLKVFKYSKCNLLKFLNGFDEKVYLFFYDLDSENFNDVIGKMNDYFNIIETKIIKINKDNHLFIFGYFNNYKLEELVAELDSMDIGEFEISSYHNINEVINSYCTRSKTHYNFSKMIYVNKDEKVIQLYNF